MYFFIHIRAVRPNLNRLLPIVLKAEAAEENFKKVIFFTKYLIFLKEITIICTVET